MGRQPGLSWLPVFRDCCFAGSHPIIPESSIVPILLPENSQDVSYCCPSLSSVFEVAAFENVSHKHSVVLLVCTILATSSAHPKFSFFAGILETSSPFAQRDSPSLRMLWWWEISLGGAPRRWDRRVQHSPLSSMNTWLYRGLGWVVKTHRQDSERMRTGRLLINERVSQYTKCTNRGNNWLL